MNRVLRWHVSRMFEPTDPDQIGATKIEFVITPESAEGMPAEFKANPAAAAEADQDRLEWWETNEELQIEGRASHELMLKTFIAGNVFKIPANAGISPTGRRIVEGMVFLQFIEDEAGLELGWKRLKNETVVPDVSPLIELEQSSWLDFTRQARQLAGTLYRRALGEKAEGENA